MASARFSHSCLSSLAQPADTSMPLGAAANNRRDRARDPKDCGVYQRTEEELALLRATPDDEQGMVDDEAQDRLKDEAANKLLLETMKELRLRDAAELAAARESVTKSFTAITPSNLVVPSFHPSDRERGALSSRGQRLATSSSHSGRSPSTSRSPSVPSNMQRQSGRLAAISDGSRTREADPTSRGSLVVYTPASPPGPSPKLPSSRSRIGRSPSVATTITASPGNNRDPNRLWDDIAATMRDSWSKFNSTARWGTMCFEEAKATLERERKLSVDTGPASPTRLMTSVCCLILEHMMETMPSYHELWPMIREEIYVALFHTPPTFEKNSSPRRSGEAGTDSSAFRQQVGNLQFTFEKLRQTQTELAEARNILETQLSMIDKFNILSEMTAHHHTKETVGVLFRGWRAFTSAKRKRHRDVDEYATSLHGKMLERTKFLQWRRFTTVARHKKAQLRNDAIRKENEDMIAGLNQQLADLKMKYTIDMEAVKLELTQERELNKSLIEGHAVMNEEHLSMRAALSDECKKVEKECKWWQRVAKAYRPVDDVYAPSEEMIMVGAALKDCEEAVLGGDLGPLELARRHIEALLLQWVNEEITRRDLSFRGIQNLEHGMRDGTIYLQLSKILTPRSDQKRTKGEMDVFSSLVSLLHAFTGNGVVPPLLLHCPFFEQLFESEDFLSFPHPMTHLWIVASLFVSKALRHSALTAHPSLVAEVSGARLSPHEQLLSGFALKSVMGTMKRRRTTKAGNRRGTTFTDGGTSPRKRRSTTASTSASPRASIANSNVPSQRRGTVRNDVTSSPPGSPATRKKSLFAKVKHDLAMDASFGDYDVDDLESSAMLSNSGVYASLPPVPVEPELESLSIKQLLDFLSSLQDRRDQWTGLARLVTVFVLRYRCLDAEHLSQKAIAAAVARQKEEKEHQRRLDEGYFEEPSYESELPGSTVMLPEL